LASQRNDSMWQLASAATNASSGSTPAGFENGARTTSGEADAATVRPPSNVQVCSRENRPLLNSAPAFRHWIIALCSAIPHLSGSGYFKLTLSPPRVAAHAGPRSDRL